MTGHYNMPEAQSLRQAHQHTVREARRRLELLTSKPTEREMARRKSGPPANESKAAKFSRLANHRLRLAIKGVDGLGKLSTNAAYEHTDAQVELIINALRAAVDRCEKSFVHGTAGTEIPTI
jgi:hypothetical protein